VPDFPLWLAPIAVAPIAGSFLGALIRRLEQGKPAVRGRPEDMSFERHSTVLSPANYMALRARIGTGHVFDSAIKLAALAVAISATLVSHQFVWLWGACFLGWALIALAWIDAKHMRLPDALTLPLVPIGIGIQTILNPERFVECLVGALVGYVSFRTVALGYRALRQRDGLGGGDAKFLAAAGAWIGWTALPDVVLLASLAGIGFFATRRMKRLAFGTTNFIPFGPCLALSLWAIYLLGPFIFDGLH
jgi:leader peptidase (prepilin peptidase) / N-methyltransferase